ncbi:MAG: hypothetical protein HEEMFOPI_00327 [Holosporales bacterium]
MFYIDHKGMKKIIVILFLIVFSKSDAEILNISELLTCARKGNKGRVEIILKNKDEFSKRMYDLTEAFNNLVNEIKNNLEVKKMLNREARNIFPNLVALKLILFSHNGENIENESLNNVLGIIEVIRFSIDQMILKILTVNRDLNMNKYIENFSAFKNYLNMIDIPLKDLIENHEEACSTKTIFDLSGKRFFEEELSESEEFESPN